ALRRELDELREAVERKTEVESRAVVLAARVEELGSELADSTSDREQLGGQIAGLQETLASCTVSRDAALSEAAALRSELERIGAELAVARRSEEHTSELQ